jgi:hypothetical protein
VKGMLVTNPGMAPAALRVDQLDREQVSLRNTSQGLNCLRFKSNSS